jgi:hypothetical protein
MSTLSDLLAEHTALSGSAVAHLQRLVSEWQLLADPVVRRFPDCVGSRSALMPRSSLCVAQARPTTGPHRRTSDDLDAKCRWRVTGRAASAAAPQLGSPRGASLAGEEDPRWQLEEPVRT